jgi:hypothetical protein
MKPLLLIERRLDEIGCRGKELDRFCRLAGFRQLVGALWSGCHRNDHFTIFDEAGKQLDRGGATPGED